MAAIQHSLLQRIPYPGTALTLVVPSASSRRVKAVIAIMLLVGAKSVSSNPFLEGTDDALLDQPTPDADLFYLPTDESVSNGAFFVALETRRKLQRIRLRVSTSSMQTWFFIFLAPSRPTQRNPPLSAGSWQAAQRAPSLAASMTQFSAANVYAPAPASPVDFPSPTSWVSLQAPAP
ncbi:hypothetical protein B0T14DRAFT_561440 [Immersiella caudata]|uniref:Uncharacterized protein n=1 Tax=Immersiella caudata TaxID=314043 RepID=A0AA39XIW0_9PEZI|nr:hypothetical protein B0T14DRAFT_561440 [Immersiella caudata]